MILSLFVRINALDTSEAEADIDAVVASRPYGIVLPKCRNSADVFALAWRLDAHEARAGIAVGETRILPPIEVGAID